ncbi:MAG: NAD+ synthase [Chloroflexi bacterium]|nr:NAD+ synthase [Chloroflexota bacterium]
MPTFRVALAQINVTVGDLAGNTAKIIDYIDRARSLRVDLVAFPELAVTGYPPEDLVFRPQFVGDNLVRMREIAAATGGITAVFGFVDRDPQLRNAAAIAYDGNLVDVYHKRRLPNYGVFDEQRYFEPGTDCPVYVVGGAAVGFNVCEDIWFEEDDDPIVLQSRVGARLIVTINGSPYHAGKLREREDMVSGLAKRHGVHMAYVNLVGGQDELVFDGASLVFGPDGQLVTRGSQFDEELIVADLDIGVPGDRSAMVTVSEAAGASAKPAIGVRAIREHDDAGEVYAALVLGTRDYVRKSGFQKVLVALSGGIDSSMVATVAADALGPENVVAVFMPSRFSSEQSAVDARDLAENLGIELRTISIEGLFSTFLDTLAQDFDGTEWGVAEENTQSRIRGNLIMALSNKLGWLVLTTGNKSEMATGYATLYGDMAGGFAVLKDVPKVLVYQLAEHRNGLGSVAVLPRSVIDKAPSAELRPDQKDEDSLPPYPVLDPILKAYVEDDLGFAEIVAQGFDEDTVKKVITLVDRSEYKRRQAPPGIKITPRNFGRDRRMPIANRYRPF